MADPNERNETNEQRTERPSSIGRDEAYTVNLKKVVDTFQQHVDNVIARSQERFDQIASDQRTQTNKLVADAQTHSTNAHALELQTLAMGNMHLMNGLIAMDLSAKAMVSHYADNLNTDNMVNKKAFKWGDMEDESSILGLQASQVDTAAIEAAVAKAVQKALAAAGVKPSA